VAARTAPTPAQTPAANFAESTDAPDAIDQLADAELDGWQRIMDPLLDPIQALMDRAKREGWTAQRLLDALPDALANMDTNPLADSLTRAAITARLAGAAGVPPSDKVA
jgi:hypothetical protein